VFLVAINGLFPGWFRWNSSRLESVRGLNRDGYSGRAGGRPHRKAVR